MVVIYAFLFLLCLIHGGSSRNCTSGDIKSYVMPCDPKTQNHKVVSYLHGECTLTDPKLIKAAYQIPCTCPPGKGLTDRENGACKPCKPGNYSAGGEDVSDWGSWAQSGTRPPHDTGIHTFCVVTRRYLKSCEHWKPSYFNDSLESGDNAQTRCMSSILMMRKQFVGPDNYVKFTYRVEGRKCHSVYMGCDGLAFFVDGKQLMPFVGKQFVWKTVRFNVTSGDHELKWTYRKNCFSFLALELVDKAFIQSITLVGTTDPHTTCKPCPPGTYSTTSGASECTKCNYFKHQLKPGQTTCTDCEPNLYSMLGSAYCIPKMQCDKNDLVMAPDPLSTCTKEKDVFMRNLKPTYSSVKIDGKDHTLCVMPTSGVPPPLRVACNCQPGLELSNEDPTAKCRPCAKGTFSLNGLKCSRCPNGHVALMGKYFYTWTKGELPQGFTANCAGDCSNKYGWYSSGDHIRTNRVVGDVDSYIQSGKYTIVSNIAYIKFSCSVLCNITQPIGTLSGNHLADIPYCNLVFEIWTNGSLADQVNCTKPKRKYVYRHQNLRDGRIIVHNYPLKKGSYQFRWVFNQGDEFKSTSAAFEAKVFNISIVRVDGGSARDCLPCDPGYYSVSDNTDCSICPNGTSSPKGSDRCIPCKEGTFADSPGSGECFPCGANTKSLPNRDGCTSNGCKFSPQKEVEYDFSQLSRENGPMFEVLRFQPPSFSRPGKHRSKRSSSFTEKKRQSDSPPYRSRYWLNLCTVKHENTSCTYRTSNFGLRQSLPVMGCRTSLWSRRDTSIGRVMGFKPKKDIRSGVIVELLHGDMCHRHSKRRYNTTIDLVCDVEAGVGNPGPENSYTQTFRPPCSYYFKWRSLYACPKCRREDFEKVTHPCVNGSATVTITRRVPCWGGMVNGMEVGVNQVKCSETIASSASTLSTPNPATTARVVTESPKVTESSKTAASVNQANCSAIYKALIGVSVVIIIVLIVVAGYLFYKHRDLKYKYYSTFTKNKPMSKLEEEEEVFGHGEGDEFNDTRNMIHA